MAAAAICEARALTVTRKIPKALNWAITFAVCAAVAAAFILLHGHDRRLAVIVITILLLFLGTRVLKAEIERLK